MIIKVCGMREPDNIKAVDTLDIDLMGFIFFQRSPRYVNMVSSMAGIIPDYADDRQAAARQESAADEATAQRHTAARVGVFVDDMPQNIVTRIYNYRLDYVQLHGSESPTMIRNLKRTVVPDIAPHLKIIKAIAVTTADDLKQCEAYEGDVDMFLFDTKTMSTNGGTTSGGSGRKFDWSLLDHYHGRTPFLLSGGIEPDDADAILAIRHPQFAGIDLNSRFETAPGVKDVEKLRSFITKIRQHE